MKSSAAALTVSVPSCSDVDLRHGSAAPTPSATPSALMQALVMTSPTVGAVPLRRTRSGSSSSTPKPIQSAVTKQQKVKHKQKVKKSAFVKRTAPAPIAADAALPGTTIMHASSLAVPVVRQESSWDCGLACARMALLALGAEEGECSLATLRSRLVSSDVWSIDLAYLLTEFGVANEYLSATLDVPSPRRRSLPFYAASLMEDGARVAALLAAAPAEGVRVRQCSLSSAELWNLMRDGEHVVICLVDERALHPRPGGLSPASPAAAARGFFGHYVLLVGLDDASDSFVLRDPAGAHETLLVTAARLERARRCRGTDEDLIVVPLDQDTVPCAPTQDTSKIQAALAGAGAR